MLIRDADETDLQAIYAIHRDAVVTTAAIWDNAPGSLDDRRQWFRQRLCDDYPVLVYVLDGTVCGYGS